jgi:hypothetical protein
VSKGLTLTDEFRRALNLPAPPPLAFTSLAEIEKHIRRRLATIDLDRLARNALDRARGRV